MAELKWRKRSRSNWEPADYTSNEVAAIIAVGAGDLVGPGFCRVTEVFNGAGTDAIIEIGLTGGDTDLFCKAGQIDETTAALYHLQGGDSAHYSARGLYLFTAADTLDLKFTCNTSGTRTTGIVDTWFFIAKADPH